MLPSCHLELNLFSCRATHACAAGKNMDSLLKALAHFIEVREEELDGVSSLSRLTPHFGITLFLST